jgi:hypothetical protein
MNQRHIFRQRAVEHYIKGLAIDELPIDEILPRIGLIWCGIVVIAILVSLIWSRPMVTRVDAQVVQAAIMPAADLERDMIEVVVEVPAHVYPALSKAHDLSICQVSAVCHPAIWGALPSVPVEAGGTRRLLLTTKVFSEQFHSGQTVVLSLHSNSILSRIMEMIHA